MIVAPVLNGLGPARRVREEVGSHALARERQRVPPAARARVQPIHDVRHPQIAALMLVVDQPDTARMAVAFFDHRLRQHAEEPVDVGLPDQQIERELHHLGLHPCEALCAAPAGRLAPQCGAKDVRIPFFRQLFAVVVSGRVRRNGFHFAIIDQSGR